MTEVYTAETYWNMDVGSTWIGIDKDNFFYRSWPASEHLTGKITSVRVLKNKYVYIQGEKGYEIRTLDGEHVESDGVRWSRHRWRDDIPNVDAR